MNKAARLRRLKKYLLEEENIEWEQYLKRFEQTKPLKLRGANYPRKFEIEGNEDGFSDSAYKIGSSAFIIRKMDPEYKITLEYKKKGTKEQLQEIPFLECSVSAHCPRYLLHKKVIDIMQQICPDDFEAIPVTIINARKDTPYFEIKDFYAINFLKCIDAIDRQNSIIDWSENDIAEMHKLRYGENPWQDGAIRLVHKTREEKYEHFKLEKPCKLAIDVVTGAYLWHPELAKELPRDSFHWFIQDIEHVLLYQ